MAQHRAFHNPKVSYSRARGASSPPPPAPVARSVPNPSNLRHWSFAPLLTRARLSRISFHELRYTFASLLFHKYVHPKFVQELLGHAYVAITLDTYSHMLPDMGGETADAIEAGLS